MTPEQYVQEKAAKSGSSFYYAFLFLPPPQRAAITAFYAFCREVDDVVDEVSDPSVAATKLAWWGKEVASSFAGQPVVFAHSAAIFHAAASAPFCNCARSEYHTPVFKTIDASPRMTTGVKMATINVMAPRSRFRASRLIHHMASSPSP